MTHRLQIGSPAIDAGDEDAVANVGGVPEFDQRGNPFTRVFDGNGDSVDRIDIGAFESNTIVLIVDTTDDENDGDYSEGDFSLREAIELSNASAAVETIGFHSSLDGQTITLSMGDLDITAAVIIETSGLNDGLTIDAVGNDFNPGIIDGFGTRVFTVDNGDSGISIDVTISGLTLTGADDPNGGGAIYNDEHLTLINSLITGNAAQWGAGIYNAQSGNLTVIGSTISGNTATGTGSGGGIYNYGGTASIIQSTISLNVAPDGGGIRNVNGGFLSLKQSTVSDNFANGNGGGILNDGNTVTIEDSTISGNDAIRGAGLYNANGYMDIVRSTISGNEASISGGGITNCERRLDADRQHAQRQFGHLRRRTLRGRRDRLRHDDHQLHDLLEYRQPRRRRHVQLPGKCVRRAQYDCVQRSAGQSGQRRLHLGRPAHGSHHGVLQHRRRQCPQRC